MSTDVTGSATPSPAGEPRPSRLMATLRGGNWTAVLFWPTLALTLAIATWEFLSQTEIVNPIVVPPASEVFTALVELVQEGFFWEATWVTVQETLLGFFIGVVGAWILGTAIGMSRIARLTLYPPAVAFQITPRIALAPLFLTWFGFGLTSKVVLAATICFFPVLISVVVGFDNVDKDARTLMRSFGGSKWEEYRKLTAPASLPIIFAGLKTAITLALIGAIVGEFVGGSEGMGVLVKTFNFQLNVAEGFAVIIVLAIIGLIMYGIVAWVDKKVVFWRGQ